MKEIRFSFDISILKADRCPLDRRGVIEEKGRGFGLHL